MGADMIGYLVRGPLKITAAMRRKAAKKLVRLAARPWKCPECGGVPEAGEFVEGERCPHCENAIMFDHARFKVLDVARAEVDNIADEWPLNYRDVARRNDPTDDKKILLFAGDMSWGDEPDDGGYQWLKRVFSLGIDEELGLE